jgi:hypothetical protein
MSAPVGSLTLTLTRGGPSVFLKCRFETLRTDGPHPLRSVHPVRVLPAMVIGERSSDDAKTDHTTAEQRTFSPRGADRSCHAQPYHRPAAAVLLRLRIERRPWPTLR